MIPAHKIQEVLERVDLVGLVSRYVELKKAGREYKGRCPFHQEKTPSFYVVPEKRFYFCHGCRASGDAVSFVQRYLGKTFMDAVKDLAREVGVDLEAAQDPGARERQQLKEATDLAAEHFRALLWEEEGRSARAYLASRGISEETARAFGLGWAPAAWTSLADRLTKAGMIEWGLNAGLVSKRSKGDGYFDFFRSRLIIPIRAPEGRPIAFGARLVDAEEGPKYLNSRESRLYNKSETLFGMDQARDEIRRRKAAVLVEGYFDCIALHQEGVKHTVALCSTALTPGHLKLLGRAEAQELFLLLDGDQAGLAAVERLAGPLLAAGAAAKVALLPQGDDPDTFIRREGAAGLERLLTEARPLTTHVFLTLLPQGKEASFEEKMAALERLKPVSAQLPVGLVRSAFFSALSGWCGLPGRRAGVLPAQQGAAARGEARSQARSAARQGSCPSGAQRTPPRPGEAPGRPGDALRGRRPARAPARGPRHLPRLRRAVPPRPPAGARPRHLRPWGRGRPLRGPRHRQARRRGGLPPARRAAGLRSGALLPPAVPCHHAAPHQSAARLHQAQPPARRAAHSTCRRRRKQLLTQRMELLSLKKRVEEEIRPSPPGTKAPMQPV